MRNIRRLAQRIAALALAEIAAGDLRPPGHRIDQLQNARAAFALADAGDHLLHNEAQPGIGRRPLGLTQQPGRGTFPSAGHRPQHGG